MVEPGDVARPLVGGEAAARDRTGGGTDVFALAFGGDGQTLATAIGDGTTRLWDLSDLHRVRGAAAKTARRGPSWRGRLRSERSQSTTPPSSAVASSAPSGASATCSWPPPGGVPPLRRGASGSVTSQTSRSVSVPATSRAAPPSANTIADAAAASTVPRRRGPWRSLRSHRTTSPGLATASPGPSGPKATTLANGSLITVRSASPGPGRPGAAGGDAAVGVRRSAADRSRAGRCAPAHASPAAVRPPEATARVHPSQRLGERGPCARRVGHRVDVLHGREQRMPDTGSGQHRQYPAPPRPGDAHVRRAPHRPQVGRRHHADHGVGPAQPLVQPLLPLLATAILTRGRRRYRPGEPWPWPSAGTCAALGAFVHSCRSVTGSWAVQTPGECCWTAR